MCVLLVDKKRNLLVLDYVLFCPRNVIHRIVFLFIFVARNVRLLCQKLKLGPVIYFYNVNGEILVISLMFSVKSVIFTTIMTDSV